MKLYAIAEAFNKEIKYQARCRASVENEILVIRRFDNEKIILMGKDEKIIGLPPGKRCKAAKALMLELRFRFSRWKAPI